jgi:N-acetylmuramoyl-L-alanine amidase
MPKAKPTSPHYRHQNDRDVFLRNVGTGMPAVLIELGFLDTASDAEKLKNP